MVFLISLAGLPGSSFIDEDQEQLHTIVSTIIDPLIESLNSLSSQFPTTDQDVFMLNSFYQVKLAVVIIKLVVDILEVTFYYAIDSFNPLVVPIQRCKAADSTERHATPLGHALVGTDEQPDRQLGPAAHLHDGSRASGQEKVSSYRLVLIFFIPAR